MSHHTKDIFSQDKIARHGSEPSRSAIKYIDFDLLSLNSLIVAILVSIQTFLCLRVRVLLALSFLRFPSFSPFIQTQNFSLLKRQYYLGINTFPNKPWFLRVCSISLLKTMWEKEKLLVTSNFSFSHIVFNHLGEIPAIFY